MSTYDFSTFLAGAIGVFILASCVYRKHIRSPKLFSWAVLQFVGAIVIYEGMANLHSPSGGFGIPVPNPRATSINGFAAIAMLGRWIMYGTLPVFYMACSGSRRAFVQCSQCGYDLTKNASGVCPECGANFGKEG